MGRELKKLCAILNQNAPRVFYCQDDNAPRHAALALMPPTHLLSTLKTQLADHMEVLTEALDWSPSIATRASSVPEVFRVGPSLIDRRTGRVETPTGARQLRAKELELIVHLYEHLAFTFSREKLLQLVWNYQPGLVTRTVDQTVATLRKKIEFDPDRPKFLQTVYGIGYRLVL